MNETLAGDVLHALVSTWRTALATYGDRALVSDGPPIRDRSSEIELWVGATGDEPEETVVTGSQQWATFGDVSNTDESLDIFNSIWVVSGSTDIAAARDLAIAVFNAAIAAVKGTSLGVTGAFAATGITTWELRQGQYSSGTGAVLRFTLHVEGVL